MSVTILFRLFSDAIEIVQCFWHNILLQLGMGRIWSLFLLLLLLRFRFRVREH